MRAKEYLSQVRLLDERITCKLADAARLQDMATRITPILREDGAAGGGGLEKMEELGIPLMNNRTVDADAAYQAWGLNIGDLERRYAKIKKMEENNNGKN